VAKLSKQCKQVVEYVETWGSINSFEAIRKLGITRLAARIHDLKGTKHEMKSVPDHNLAPGFVKYVPDFEQRTKRIHYKMVDRLGDLDYDTPPDVMANFLVDNAAKFSAVAHQRQGV